MADQQVQPEQKPLPTQQPSSTQGLSLLDKVLKIVNTSHLRFAWFLGNLAVIFNSLLYLFTYRFTIRSTGIFNSIWYRLVLLGAIDTFGIVLFQNKKQFYKIDNSLNKSAILHDDNAHYLYNALIWLVLPKKYTLAIVPFFAFSIFHVSNFVGSEVIPTLGVLGGFSSTLKNFTLKYHESSRRIAAGAELLLLAGLIVDALFWRPYSLIALILYSLFIKLKSETSVFTKTILKNWEVRVDGLVSSQSVPPIVKSSWVSFKRGFKKLNQYNLVSKTEEITKTN